MVKEQSNVGVHAESALESTRSDAFGESTEVFAIRVEHCGIANQSRTVAVGAQFCVGQVADTSFFGVVGDPRGVSSHGFLDYFFFVGLFFHGSSCYPRVTSS